MSAAENKAKLMGLIEALGSGQVLAKWDEFYDPNVVMRENGVRDPERIGREKNLAYETYFMTNAKWLKFELGPVLADGDHTAYQATMAFEFLGNTIERDQWSVQTWKDGRIVDEAFYYKG